MSIEVLPVEGLPEVRPGDDLATLLAGPLGSVGVRDGDVVAVTQKIVSKAEGRVVPEARRRPRGLGRAGDAAPRRPARRPRDRRDPPRVRVRERGRRRLQRRGGVPHAAAGGPGRLGGAAPPRAGRTARRRDRRRDHGHVRQDLAARRRERRDRLRRHPGARRPPRDHRPPRPRARGDGRGARRRGGGRERARDGQGGAGAGRDRAGRGVRAGGGPGGRDGPAARGGPVPNVPAPVDLGAADDPGVRGRRGVARGGGGGGSGRVHGAGAASHATVVVQRDLEPVGEAAAARRDRGRLARGSPRRRDTRGHDRTPDREERRRCSAPRRS